MRLNILICSPIVFAILGIECKRRKITLSTTKKNTSPERNSFPSRSLFYSWDYNYNIYPFSFQILPCTTLCSLSNSWPFFFFKLTVTACFSSPLIALATPKEFLLCLLLWILLGVFGSWHEYCLSRWEKSTKAIFVCLYKELVYWRFLFVLSLPFNI